MGGNKLKNYRTVIQLDVFSINLNKTNYHHNDTNTQYDNPQHVFLRPVD
jgi:hypothetical protein